MLRALLVPALALAASTTSAAQFSIASDINGGSASYSGSVPLLGFVLDGGLDAVDGYGFLTNLGGLTVQRQVDALIADNTYRWLDIFTNTSAATVTRTVRFQGDMGSNAQTTIRSSAPGLLVTSDNGAGGPNNRTQDPIAAHVSGSQTFVGGSMVRTLVGDDYLLDISMTLAPGESAGFLNYLALARTAGAGPALNNSRPADIALATTMGQNLLANPILTGLSQAQLNTVRNFAVGATPEPTTLALLAVGLVGLTLAGRRRRLANIPV